MPSTSTLTKCHTYAHDISWPVIDGIWHTLLSRYILPCHYVIIEFPQCSLLRYGVALGWSCWSWDPSSGYCTGPPHTMSGLPFKNVHNSFVLLRYHDMSSKHGLSNIGYCFFICFGSLLQQGSTTVPAADSGWPYHPILANTSTILTIHPWSWPYHNHGHISIRP